MDVPVYKRAYKYGACARKAEYTWEHAMDNWIAISSTVYERIPSVEEIDALKRGFGNISEREGIAASPSY